MARKATPFVRCSKATFSFFSPRSSFITCTLSFHNSHFLVPNSSFRLLFPS